MRFCVSCGNQLADDALFCAACGTSQEVAQAEPSYQQAQGQSAYAQAVINNGSGSRISDWDGGVLETIVSIIVASLMISFTCGFATPWAICYLYKFVLEHAVIDGKRLSFDGNGGQLLGNWIKWFLLCLITFGIYGFWVTPRLIRWVCSHTHVQQ